MSKRVLGNDPFKRGAADRSAEPVAKQPQTRAQPPPEKPHLPDPRVGETNKRVKSRKPGAPFLDSPEKEPQKTRIETKQKPAPPLSPPKDLKRSDVSEREGKSSAPSTNESKLRPPAAESPRREVHAALQPITLDAPSNSTRDQVYDARRVDEPSSLQKVAIDVLGRAVVAAAGLVKAVRAGLGAAGAVDLDAYGKDETLGDALEPITDFLYEQYWRVQVSGAERLPRGPCILVANHSGALPWDGPVLHEALRRERPELHGARWLIEDQIFYAPVMGTLLNRLGAVRANPENAVRLLEEHRPLIVFPEGIHGMQKPFADRYQLKRFGRGGFVKISLQTGAPIFPVAIVGAEETSPLLARIPTTLFGVPYLPLSPLGPIPLPAKWHIRIGAPLTPDDLRAAGDDESVRVQRGTELTREAIQGMLESLLRERPGAFR